jgi:hypothetical protein
VSLKLELIKANQAGGNRFRRASGFAVELANVAPSGIDRPAGMA